MGGDVRGGLTNDGGCRIMIPEPDQGRDVGFLIHTPRPCAIMGMATQSNSLPLSAAARVSGFGPRYPGRGVDQPGARAVAV